LCSGPRPSPRRFQVWPLLLSVNFSLWINAHVLHLLMRPNNPDSSLAYSHPHDWLPMQSLILPCTYLCSRLKWTGPPGGHSQASWGKGLVSFSLEGPMLTSSWDSSDGKCPSSCLALDADWLRILHEILSAICIPYQDHITFYVLSIWCLRYLHNHGPNLFSVVTPKERRDGTQLVTDPICQGPLHWNREQIEPLEMKQVGREVHCWQVPSMKVC
jgi:hypothetical protein